MLQLSMKRSSVAFGMFFFFFLGTYTYAYNSCSPREKRPIPLSSDSFIFSNRLASLIYVSIHSSTSKKETEKTKVVPEKLYKEKW